MDTGQMRVRYKVVHENGTVRIESEMAHNVSASRTQPRRWSSYNQMTPTTWYDLGNGQHVREDRLDELTQPYGGSDAEVRTEG